jgi:hypothetical protein
MTQRVALPSGTDGAWRRVEVTLTPTQRVARIDFMVVVDNDLGHDYEIFVDACQLELGMAATSFDRKLDESPFWMAQNGRQSPFFLEALGAAAERTVEHIVGDEITYNEYPRYRIWATNDQFDWWLNSIPTRADSPVEDEDDLEATVRTRYGFGTNPEDRSRRAAVFQISDDATKIQWVYEETPIDVIFEYQIADHFMDGGFYNEYGIPAEEDENFEIEIEAITVHKDMVWAVAKETWNGVTKRVLKILLPFQRPDVLADDDQPNFLETVRDIDLAYTSGSVTAIGFVDGDDTKLQMTIDGTDYIVNLWYDYVFFDRDVATSALLRHNYGSQDLVMR